MGATRTVGVLHISTPTSWRGGESQVSLLLQELAGDYRCYLLCPAQSMLYKYVKKKIDNVVVLTDRFARGWNILAN